MTLVRLPPQTALGPMGLALNRNRPLSFRLDGRVISGFEGDTIVTALLGSGILAAGTAFNQPVALEEQFAPLVAHRDGPGQAFPAARTPALEGLDLVSLDRDGQPVRLGFFNRLVRRRSDRLDHALTPESLWPTWTEDRAESEFRADVVVIGAGLAGLMAARAVIEAGRSVLVLEKTGQPGGMAGFFSPDGDGVDPDRLVADALKALGGKARARIITQAEAFRLEPGAVRFHQVLVEHGRPRGRVALARAPAVIVATGSVERPALFAGNRLPGVIGAVAAHRLMQRFGLWFGNRLVVSTTHNNGTRFALRLKDMGADVLRIADTRVRPVAREIDLAMAAGLALGVGMVPDAVVVGRGPHRLNLGFTLSFDGGAPSATRLDVDQLIVAGGFQPALELLVGAGMALRFDAAEQRFVGVGPLPEGVAMAGAVAGFMSHGAVAASATRAAAGLFGKALPQPEEPGTSALFFSPPGPSATAAAGGVGAVAAYLDHGPGLVTRAVCELHRDGRMSLLDEPQPLSLGGVAALVGMGVLSPLAAAEVARSRATSGAPIRLQAPGPRTGRGRTGVPDYLAGRFGKTPLQVRLMAGDGTVPPIGALIYADVDEQDPRHALGVVYGPPLRDRPGALALIARLSTRKDELVFFRDRSHTVLAAKVAEVLKP
jgi:sarcosine oxidase subunit alpha